MSDKDDALDGLAERLADLADANKKIHDLNNLHQVKMSRLWLENMKLRKALKSILMVEYGSLEAAADLLKSLEALD